MKAVKLASQTTALRDLKTDNTPFTAVVSMVAVSGTVQQRRAMAQCLTYEACAALPEVAHLLGSKDAERAEALFTKMFADLCAGFAQQQGVRLAFDAELYAGQFLSDYGGLTTGDLLKFFDGLTRGKYRGGFEHISAHGINAEHLNAWLVNYNNERFDVLDELRRTAAKNARMAENAGDYIEMAELFRDIEAQAKIRAEINGEIKAKRSAWVKKHIAGHAPHIVDEGVSVNVPVYDIQMYVKRLDFYAWMFTTPFDPEQSRAAVVGALSALKMEWQQQAQEYPQHTKTQDAYLRSVVGQMVSFIERVTKDAGAVTDYLINNMAGTELEAKARAMVPGADSVQFKGHAARIVAHNYQRIEAKYYETECKNLMQLPYPATVHEYALHCFCVEGFKVPELNHFLNYGKNA